MTSPRNPVRPLRSWSAARACWASAAAPSSQARAACPRARVGSIAPAFWNVMVMRPPITSVKFAPRYGTCTMSRPSWLLNTSPAMCCGVPAPGLANESLPGCAFASAISSATLFAGTSLLTARMLGDTSSRAIGARSRGGSKAGLGCSDGLIVIAPFAPQYKRVAVGRRLRDALAADAAARAGNVLDRHRHAQDFGQLLREHAAGDVGGAARREADDDADRAIRIGLRARVARGEQRQRDQERTRTSVHVRASRPH